MRFVATKTPEQQSCLILHRTRHLLIRQQRSVINASRGHLAEFGIVAPVGRNGVEQMLGVVADASDKRQREPQRSAAFGARLGGRTRDAFELRRVPARHCGNGRNAARR